MKLKTLKFPVSLFMASVLSLQIFSMPIMASQTSSSESEQSSSQVTSHKTDEVGFSVEAKLPQNQIDSNVTYFDLKMEPEDKQTLEVEVRNTSSEEITVKVQAITASTNRNGIIDYRTPDVKDESMKTAFSEIAVPQEDILTIPENSSKVAKINVTMPEEEYDGVILGAIFLQKVALEENEDVSAISSKPKTAGTTIENTYSYAIGVKLTETDKEILPDFEVVSVEPTLINHQKAITNNIRNTQAAIVKGMDVSVKIHKENSSEILLENSLTNVDMAPNSVLPFPVLLNEVNLAPGKYISSIHLQLGEDEWDFDQPFEITADAVNMWKEQEIKETAGIPIWAIVLICIGVLILLALIFFIILLLKKRSKGEDSEEK